MVEIKSEYTDLKTGQIIVVTESDPSIPEVDEVLLKQQSMKCSRLQGRITLGETVCASLDAIADDPTTPWAMREAIKNSVEWQRTSPTMDELGWLLGYTPEQMDTLFEQAITVAV